MRQRSALVILALFTITRAFAQSTAELEGGTMVFNNEAKVINATSWPVLIKVVPKQDVMQLQGSQFVLGPNSSASIGQYTDANAFVSSVDVMTVTGTVRNRKGKPQQIGVLMMEKKQVDATHRTYIYHVMGSGGNVGFGF